MAPLLGSFLPLCTPVDLQPIDIETNKQKKNKYASGVDILKRILYLVGDMLKRFNKTKKHSAKACFLAIAKLYICCKL